MIFNPRGQLGAKLKTGPSLISLKTHLGSRKEAKKTLKISV
jgi:hypothetical protein